MQTYVFSLRDGARLAHIGNAHATACGIVLTSSFHVAERVPADRVVCARCASAVGSLPDDAPGALTLARDGAITALLALGLNNAGVAKRLHLGLNTAVRYIGEAQRRAGARTRFEWGYLVGRAEPNVRRDPAPAADPWKPVPIHGVYGEHVVRAEFTPATRRIRITSGPLAGSVYTSPSGAARAVVLAFNPERVSTQTNGWLFWRISATTAPLDAYRAGATS